MKKLTAGIFTVLMGLVSVNAADAAVASKAYVDAKAASEASAAQTAAETTAAGALSSAKTELEGKINAKVAQADYDAKIEALEAADKTFATTSAMNTELAKKQNNLTVTGGVLTWDAETSTLGLTGIATSGSLETLQNTVNTLSADANTDGSVKKQIADAIAGEVERADDAYDAKGAAAAAQSAAETTAAGALSSAKSELEGKINAKVAQTAYDEKIQALEAADATFATTSAMNTELAKKQDVISDLDTIRSGAALGATSFQAASVAEGGEDVAPENLDKFVPTLDRVEDMINNSQTELISAVSDNTDAIALINDAENGILKQAQTYADGKDTALKAELEGKITTAGGSAATAQSAAEAAQAAADAAQAAADDAQADATQALTNAAAAQADATQALTNAATAQSAADAAQETADAAIPKPTGPCANPTNKCVLTFNNAEYAWEVIERATGETGF